RRHTRSDRDWSSDVCSSDLNANVHIDIHVLLFTALLSVCAGVFFGLAPAGHVRLSDLRSVLNETERGGVGKQAKGLRSVLVISRSEERRVGKECGCRWALWR